MDVTNNPYLCRLNCEVVKYLKRYRIPFSGLKVGDHVFDFDIDKKFFDCFEYSLVKDGNLQATVSLARQENMLVADFHIEGQIELNCDICLSDFPAKTVIDERLIVKFTEEDMGDTTEEILVLSKNEYGLDIADLLYEYINLAVPHYKKCSEQGDGISCDPEMVDKLSNLAPQPPQETTEEEQTDPRWEALKHLRNN